MTQPKPPRSTAELPPGWRPEWRPPKSKPAPAAPAAAAPPAAESAARRRARAREERLRQAQTDVTKSLPSRADLFERGVRTLWEIAGDVGEEAKDRNVAAKALVELATRGKLGGQDLEHLSDEEIEVRRRALMAQMGVQVAALEGAAATESVVPSARVSSRTAR